MAGVAMRMLVLTLLTFKKVKLIFGHPVFVGLEPGLGTENLPKLLGILKGNFVIFG